MATGGLRRFLRKSVPSEGPDRTSQATFSGASTLLSGAPASVLRAPAGYACGLCGSQFSSFADAQGCVEKCAVRQRLREPLLVLASPCGTHFRCSLCSRERVHRDDALRCFESCLERLRHAPSLPHPLSDALEDLRLSDVPTRAHSGHPHGAPHPRGPLFRGRQGPVLGGHNHGLRGLHSHAPQALAEGHSQAHPRPELPPPAKSTTLASQAPHVPRRTLTADEMARKTEELLMGEVPEGADVALADAFGASELGMEGRLAIDGLDDTSGEAFREGATLGEFGDHTPDEGMASGTPGFREDAPAPEVPSALADEPFANEPLADATPAAPAGPMRDAQGNIIYREPGMKPFKRADARYVCTACSSKYFTKNEVEQCFMDHPIRPGSDMA